GSLNKGYADKYSDIDIICITRKKIGLVSLKEQILKLNKNAKIIGKQIQFDYNVTITSIILKKFSDLVQKAKTIKKRFNLSIYKEIYFLKDYKVIEGDKTDIQKIIKLIPSKLSEEFIEEEFNNLYPWIINNISESGRLEIEIKRKNIISFEYRFSRTVGWLIKLIYEVNGILFEDARWAIKEIPKMKIKPKNFIKRLETCLKNKNLNTKLKLLRSIVYDFNAILK
ncbi:MAG: hypothetical protein P8X70_03400, partial [Nanoarchaeota archaeon]